MCRLHSGFQNIPNPPLHLSLGTASIDWKFKSKHSFRIFAIDHFVSIRNKTVGPFFLTNLVNASTAR